MSGVVGLIASDTSRYTMFHVCKDALQMPVNTHPEWAITSDRIVGRNKVVAQALDRGAEWILFLDDDHVFPSHLLMRLLAHDKPVVGSLYVQRMVPFAPVAYTHKTDEERYVPVDLTQHGPDDLIEVAAVGTGGMLIRSEVLHQMEPPWFYHGRASEDLIFCDRVYEEGFGPIYVDLGCRMGHMSPAALWPTFDRETEAWMVGFSLTEGFSVTVPIGSEVTA